MRIDWIYHEVPRRCTKPCGVAPFGEARLQSRGLPAAGSGASFILVVKPINPHGFVRLRGPWWLKPPPHGFRGPLRPLAEKTSMQQGFVPIRGPSW